MAAVENITIILPTGPYAGNNISLSFGATVFLCQLCRVARDDVKSLYLIGIK